MLSLVAQSSLSTIEWCKVYLYGVLIRGWTMRNVIKGSVVRSLDPQACVFNCKLWIVLTGLPSHIDPLVLISFSRVLWNSKGWCYILSHVQRTPIYSFYRK